MLAGAARHQHPDVVGVRRHGQQGVISSGDHLDSPHALAYDGNGGLYVIDDLNPQLGWAEDHLPKVQHLLSVLEGREDLSITKLNWSVGLLVAVKR